MSRKADKLELMARAIMTDEQYEKFKLLEKEQETDNRKAALIGHIVSYLLVCGLMVMVWAFTDPVGYFWPVWVIVPWGVGLVGHMLLAFLEAVR